MNTSLLDLNKKNFTPGDPRGKKLEDAIFSLRRGVEGGGLKNKGGGGIRNELGGGEGGRRGGRYFIVMLYLSNNLYAFSVGTWVYVFLTKGMLLSYIIRCTE